MTCASVPPWPRPCRIHPPTPNAPTFLVCLSLCLALCPSPCLSLCLSFCLPFLSLTFYISPLFQAIRYLSCLSLMPISYAYLACLSLTPISHAFLSCLSLMPFSHAFLSCLSLMPFSHAFLSCLSLPSHITFFNSVFSKYIIFFHDLISFDDLYPQAR